MNLLSLPREVLIMVLQKLDTPALYAVYSTCSELKSLISDFSIVKACSLSLNSMSSSSSLKLDFITDISRHIQQLDLSGVRNLTRTSVLPVMKKLVSLRTLNIQFTSLNLMDFVEFHKLCPTIRDISIELEFGNVAKNSGRNWCADSRIADEVIEMCQETFQHMENVHFSTTSENALYGNLPRIILYKCKHLADITVTGWRNTCNSGQFFYDYREDRVELTCSYKQWSTQTVTYFDVNILSNLLHDYLDIEFIVICIGERQEAVISLGLYDFWEKNMDVIYQCESIFTDYPSTITIKGAINTLKWPRGSNFDDVFYCKLMKQLRRILPTSAFKNNSTEKDCWDVATITEAMTQSRSNVMMPEVSQPTQQQFKRKRIVPSSYMLDFEQYKDKELLKLEVLFVNPSSSIAMSSTSNYLEKLTSLTLFGVVSYRDDFFHTLFSTCIKLTTLHVITTASKCFLLMSKSVKKSSSLKNLRLVGDIPRHVLSDLSDCKTIEIIFLEDHCHGELKPGIKDLLLKLPNLRVLYMTQKEMTEAHRTRSMKYINDLKIEYERQSVDIVLNSNRCLDEYKIYYGYRNNTVIKGLSYAFIFLKLFNLAKRDKNNAF